MKAKALKRSWSALFSLTLVAVPLSGCYTVLQKSGSYYSEFGEDSQSVEVVDEIAETDSVETESEYAEQGMEENTVIINRYYTDPWYDGYYPYRWGFGIGYASWPYYYGYYGWPYYGVYYSPWWNDYYYTGWCYYPRHYYGYWHYPHGWTTGPDDGIRRTYTGRRTNLGGGNLGGSGSGYGAGGSTIRTTSDGSSVRNGDASGSLRKTGGSKKGVRSGQKQTKVKEEGRRGTGGSRNVRGNQNETKRNGGSEGGVRRNKDTNDSGQRRSSRITTGQSRFGFSQFFNGGMHQRSFFNSGHSGFGGQSNPSSSSVRSGDNDGRGSSGRSRR